jgi:hypothetical protein
MAVDPNKGIEEIVRKEFRSGGFEGTGYSGPCEYDSGMLTSQVPEGSGMTNGAVGSPSAYRKFNYSKSSNRKLPSKKGFKESIK